MSAAAKEMSMQEVTNRVMASFADPEFQAQVETFVNCHIEEFAVVHFDGSCPMIWVNLHRKYKKLYEDLLNTGRPLAFPQKKVVQEAVLTFHQGFPCGLPSTLLQKRSWKTVAANSQPSCEINRVADKL